MDACKANERRSKHIKTKESDVELPFDNAFDVSIEFQENRRSNSRRRNMERGKEQISSSSSNKATEGCLRHFYSF